MTWIWQHPDWPAFTLDRSRLRTLEARFLHEAGRRIGDWQHLDAGDQVELRVQWLSTEALETSAIEGEILDRASLQSSIQRHFGLGGERRATSPAEAGVADMMVSLYSEFDRPLDHDMLWRWHRMLMGERRAAAAGAFHAVSTCPRRLNNVRLGILRGKQPHRVAQSANLPAPVLKRWRRPPSPPRSAAASPETPEPFRGSTSCGTRPIRRFCAP